MRRHGRIDANQKEIVKAFRDCGASVLSLADLGKGVPDLIVACAQNSCLVEVKDGKKPPSKQKLTDGQVKFHAKWRGPIAIVNCVDDAIGLVNKMRGGKL